MSSSSGDEKDNLELAEKTKNSLEPKLSSIDPATSLNMPPPEPAKNNVPMLNVTVDFDLFFDRPTRDEAGQIVEMGINYRKFQCRDVCLQVEEGLNVTKFGQMAVEQTLRLQPGSRYMVDLATFRVPSGGGLIIGEDELVTSGTHYNLVLYRI